MKSKALIICILLMLSSVASAANEKGNGGDLCEDRFKIIRDDIISWIKNGGPDGLSLPVGLSVEKYSIGMLGQMLTAKISCDDEVIKVNGAEKTCKNFVDSTGTPQIVCNATRFLATDDSDQYVLVHHEYAGLAGYEVNTGEDSHYPISNQISEYLEEQLVKKLAIKVTSHPTASMTFVAIQPGTFLMGSPKDEPGHEDYLETQHQVTLTHGFEMQTTDVTQKQWIEVMGKNPSFF